MNTPRTLPDPGGTLPGPRPPLLGYASLYALSRPLPRWAGPPMACPCHSPISVLSSMASAAIRRPCPASAACRCSRKQNAVGTITGTGIGPSTCRAGNRRFRDMAPTVEMPCLLWQRAASVSTVACCPPPGPRLTFTLQHSAYNRWVSRRHPIRIAITSNRRHHDDRSAAHRTLGLW